MELLPNRKQKIYETILLMATFFFWTAVAYWGSRLITQSFTHYDMTTAFDQRTPFLPWTVLIYFACYVFWIVNIAVCVWQDAKERNRFFCADAMGKIVALILFIAIPTTNIRPEISDSQTVGNVLMRFLYRADPADNLFPSIHCFDSWLCWIGIRKRKNTPLVYRIFTLLFAVAICLSTLTTKQHVIVDVFAGIFLAELAYFLSGIPKLYTTYGKMLSKLLSVFSKKKNQPE